LRMPNRRNGELGLLQREEGREVEL
jgi:hypothetical protein